MAFPTLILDKIGSSGHSGRTLQTSGTDAVAVHVGHAGGVQITVVACFTGRADRGSCVGVVALVTDDGVHISSPRAVVPSGTVHTVRDVLSLDLIVILSCWAWCGQHRGLRAVVALWAIVTLFPGGVTGLVAVGTSMAGVSGSCGGTIRAPMSFIAHACGCG